MRHKTGEDTIYRLAAVRAYAERSAEEVAAFFKTAPETVVRWAAKYHSLGLKGLENAALASFTPESISSIWNCDDIVG